MWSEQTHRFSPNLETALGQWAGATLADVVRARYFIAEGAGLGEGRVNFRQYHGRHPPASTAIICKLGPRMKIEIEVTAKRRS